MRVLRIVSQLDFGGVERMIETTLPALIQQDGIVLKVLVLGKGGRVSRKIEKWGIDVITWDRNPKIPSTTLIFRVKEFCLLFKPDVVHCHGAEANFHGILGAYLARIPVRIAEEIGIPNHHSMWKYIFRIVYKFSTSVLAVAFNVKKKLLEFKEAPELKITVLHNPIDDVQRFDFIKKTNEIVFITVSRLVPIKNLSSLIFCFSELIKQHNHIRLWIVGDGPEWQNLNELAEKLELQSFITFFGFLEHPRIELSQANVFILPSLSEGSPIALIEAMSVGLPSIVTQVGGAGEILGDSKSGILIDPLDMYSIKAAMRQMIDLPPEVWKEMSDRAIKEARRFSLKNYIQELIKIYHRSPDF